MAFLFFIFYIFIFFMYLLLKHKKLLGALAM